MKKWWLAFALCAFSAQAQQDTDAGPAIVHFAVTPDNATELVDSRGRLLCRALFIAGAGTLALVDVDDNEVSYTVTAGFILPFGPKIVKSTGTTATGIVCWGR